MAEIVRLVAIPYFNLYSGKIFFHNFRNIGIKTFDKKFLEVLDENAARLTTNPFYIITKKVSINILKLKKYAKCF